MTEREARPQPAATIRLAQACRIAGISTATATKLMRLSPPEFPSAFWIGGRRYVVRRQFELWLAQKTGTGVSL